MLVSDGPMSIERGEFPIQSPLGQLERSLIEGFLRANGYDSPKLAALGDEQRARLLKEASLYASARLSEIEARSHYVEEMHRTEETVTKTHAGERSADNVVEFRKRA
jgi:hypothetical protein